MKLCNGSRGSSTQQPKLLQLMLITKWDIFNRIRKKQHWKLPIVLWGWSVTFVILGSRWVWSKAKLWLEKENESKSVWNGRCKIILTGQTLWSWQRYWTGAECWPLQALACPVSDILMLFVAVLHQDWGYHSCVWSSGDRNCMKNGGKKDFTWEPLLNGHHDNITSCCPAFDSAQ